MTPEKTRSRKAKEAKAVEQPPKDSVKVERRFADDKPNDAIAWMLSRPEVRAAATIQKCDDNLEVNALINELTVQVEAVNKGDMKRGEAMLFSQAHTLDELFNSLARRAMGNFSSGHLQAGETYLRLALKAQSQARASIESLGNLKNPPIVYAKQANISNGPQQVNNGTASPTAHAEKNEIVPNKLLEGGANGSAQMDIGATTATARGYPAMAALGAVNRPKEPRG